MDRVRTGIPGLDEILGGGFPRRASLLVQGPPGSGKSILCWQFLHQGAESFDESGVLVTTEDKPEELKRLAVDFGWDLRSLEERKKLLIVDAFTPKIGVPSGERIRVEATDAEALLYTIHRAVSEINAERLVIDSLTGLCIQIPQSEVSNFLFKFLALLREIGCTSLVTTQPSREPPYHQLALAEPMTHGIIEVDVLYEGDQAIRTLRVKKMRGAKHRLEVFPLQITERGIVIRHEVIGESIFQKLQRGVSVIEKRLGLE